MTPFPTDSSTENSKCKLKLILDQNTKGETVYLFFLLMTSRLLKLEYISF